MHLLDVHVMHLILSEVIRGQVDGRHCQVQQGQAVTTRTGYLVVKDVDLEVVYTKGCRGVRREGLLRLNQYRGTTRRI